MDDFQSLLEIGFDEKRYFIISTSFIIIIIILLIIIGRFGAQIGFCRAKSFMENLLNEKYHQSLAPTLRLLETICKKTEQEIVIVKKYVFSFLYYCYFINNVSSRELQENNIEVLKAKVHKYVQAFIVQVERLLEGSIVGDPDIFGQTLREEKDTCGTHYYYYFKMQSFYSFDEGIPSWPSFEYNFDIQNMNFRLYGGAQYERLLNEFEYVAHSREFPTPSMHEVASALGSAKSHNVPVFETAVLLIILINYCYISFTNPS